MTPAPSSNVRDQAYPPVWLTADSNGDCRFTPIPGQSASKKAYLPRAKRPPARPRPGSHAVIPAELIVLPSIRVTCVPEPAAKSP
jgi:hypothetical protein